MPESRVYDGHTAEELCVLLSLTGVHIFETVTSTLDMAHRLASQGAPPGTLVLAEHQTLGRGRAGRRWTSGAGDGVWLTLIERPQVDPSLELLTLRLGLAAAAVLDPFTRSGVGLKWPNDLYTGGGKLAGILVEARWRSALPDWVAIGFGLNVRLPDDQPRAAAVDTGSRSEILVRLVPALRAAARLSGPLSVEELSQWYDRDIARGRSCTEPARGKVLGIGADGSLMVMSESGNATFTTGSLVLEEA